MIEPTEAVRIAERLSCLRGFPRGANRAATLAEVAITLLEKCTDDRQAVAVTEIYRPVRWQGTGHFREHVSRLTAPPVLARPAHWRGYLLSEPPVADDEMFDRVDAAAAAAIDRLQPLDRANLEREANRLGTNPMVLRKRMIALWLDQYERQCGQNPEPLPASSENNPSRGESHERSESAA